MTRTEWRHGGSRRALWVSALAGLIAIGLGVACSKTDKITGPAGQLHTIVISPAPDTVAVGASKTLTATGEDASGRTISGLTFFWSSSSDSVATVTQGGQVTGVVTGSVEIAASVAGVSGFASVVISPKPVGSIVVVPASATLRIATTLQLSDTVKDASGNVLTGQTITWSSDSAPIVSVDGNGLVTARALGVAHITAASGGKSAISTITVSQVPVRSITITPAAPGVFVTQTSQLTAVTKDSAGDVLPGRVVRWNSENTSIATIDSVAGLLTGVSAGTVQIHAVSEGVTDSVTATVSNAPASTVILSPNVSQVDVGATVTLTATVTNSTGGTVPNPTVNFTSLNAGVASVTSETGATGQILAGPASGTATIKGTSGAATGTATIIVSLVGIDSVHISAAHDTLTPTQTETLTATAYDSSGNALSGRTVTWQSSNTAVATVNSGTGAVTAVAPGVAVIFATINGVKGSLALVVNPVPVGSVSIAPHADTIQVLQQFQLTATVKDINGNVINPPQTWYTPNTSIAVVTSTGLVTGVGPGTAMIIDSTGGKADTNTTLVIAPVATVTLSPPTATITLAQTQTLVPTLLDAHGNPLTGRTIAWTSSNHAVDTVSQAGIVYPVGTGTDTITASVTQPSGTVSGIAVITVADPVATVIVYPSPDTIFATAANNTVQLNDSAKDASGTYLPGRPVTWSLTSGTVVTVNASGLVSSNNTAAGNAVVTATSSNGPAGNGTIVVLGHSQSATMTILPDSTLSASGTGFPISATGTVTVLDTFGNPVESTRPVTWHTSDVTTVTINGLAASSVTTTAGASVTLTAITNNSSPVTITVTAVDNPSVATTTAQLSVMP